MSPTFESIRLAIERRLASWDGVPVEYDGAPQTPELKAAIEAKQSWVRCTIQHGASLVASISNRPETRRTGIIQLQVFTPENRGSRPAALLADSLAAHFEYHQDGHLTTDAASVQRVGESDGWYQYNVGVPFSAGC
ncbi:phage tail terminator-like protein [Vreelandella aquamarina]|uniref:phage tail terminator-like protein n=1 Tax=Vreelandella aquamarina TaxID=77097 RepID=UPI003D031455